MSKSGFGNLILPHLPPLPSTNITLLHTVTELHNHSIPFFIPASQPLTTL